MAMQGLLSRELQVKHAIVKASRNPELKARLSQLTQEERALVRAIISNKQPEEKDATKLVERTLSVITKIEGGGNSKESHEPGIFGSLASDSISKSELYEEIANVIAQLRKETQDVLLAPVREAMTQRDQIGQNLLGLSAKLQKLIGSQANKKKRDSCQKLIDALQKIKLKEDALTRLRDIGSNQRKVLETNQEIEKMWITVQEFIQNNPTQQEISKDLKKPLDGKTIPEMIKIYKTHINTYGKDDKKDIEAEIEKVRDQISKLEEKLEKQKAQEHFGENPLVDKFEEEVAANERASLRLTTTIGALEGYLTFIDSVTPKNIATVQRQVKDYIADEYLDEKKKERFERLDLILDSMALGIQNFKDLKEEMDGQKKTIQDELKALNVQKRDHDLRARERGMDIRFLKASPTDSVEERHVLIKEAESIAWLCDKLSTVSFVQGKSPQELESWKKANADLYEKYKDYDFSLLDRYINKMPERLPKFIGELKQKWQKKLGDLRSLAKLSAEDKRSAAASIAVRQAKEDEGAAAAGGGAVPARAKPQSRRDVLAAQLQAEMEVPEKREEYQAMAAAYGKMIDHVHANKGVNFLRDSFNPFVRFLRTEGSHPHTLEEFTKEDFVQIREIVSSQDEDRLAKLKDQLVLLKDKWEQKAKVMARQAQLEPAEESKYDRPKFEDDML